MEKSLLRAAILQALQEEYNNLTRGALMAREEATSEESKPENKYDTRGQEAAYLAESQAKIAAEVLESLNLYSTLPFPDFASHQAAAVGALCTLEARGRSSYFLLAPRQGGLEISVDGKTVTLITPHSPLGRQLQGRLVGAEVTLPGRTGPVLHRFSAIA